MGSPAPEPPPPDTPPEPPPPPPPDPPVPSAYGGGGGGGAGHLPGVGASGLVSGASGSLNLGGSGGNAPLPGRVGGAGGNLGLAGTPGTAGTVRGAGSGGLAGSSGSAGLLGANGVAILGNTKITFTNAGTITGNQRSDYTFNPVIEGMRFVTAIRSGTSNLTIPSDVAQAGDIAFFFDDASGSNVTPTGFTPITSVLSPFSTWRASVSYKKLVSADLGATITGATGTYTKILAVFRPNYPANTITISTINTQSTSGTPTTQLLTMTGQTAPVLAFGMRSGVATVGGTLNATTGTWSGDIETSIGSTGIYYLRLSKGTTPGTANVGMNDSGTQNILISFYATFT